MTPEVEISVIYAVPCRCCGARIGWRCRDPRRPHFARVLADLFKENPLS